MQKAFLKLAFVSSVFVSMSFAGGTDLLSLATDGAVTTAKAEMVGVKVLSSDEMGDVKGGYYVTSYTYQGATYNGLTSQYGGYINSSTGVWNRGKGDGVSNFISAYKNKYK